MKRYNSTPEAIARLHEAVDKVRSTSTTVRVNRNDLVNLLLDHSQVAGYLLDLGIIVQEPQQACPVAPASCQPAQACISFDPVKQTMADVGRQLEAAYPWGYRSEDNEP